jgi:hypothetical protein
MGDSSQMAKYSWLGPVRSAARQKFFEVLHAALATDDGRRLLADALTGVVRTSPLPQVAWKYSAPPYADLGSLDSIRSEGKPAPVFVTGRFRSGSTLMWSLFRNVPGCTAFYEPLNERRWFDPATRGDRVDGTHIGVTEYWREYEGQEHLGEWYRFEWTRRRLYMDADAWDPGLEAYVQALIEAAPERAVLQFNRVDFRLPWLRQRFPHARVIHIYRHPRDQWCSSLVDAASVPRTCTIETFAPHDQFYLLSWARDLCFVFPFVDPRAAEHPYDVFYYLWKLSYIFGQTYSDASFALETLCTSPEMELPRLMEAAGVRNYEREPLCQLIVPQPGGKWVAYADNDWFAAREARCESVMRQYFLPAGLPPDGSVGDRREARERLYAY